MLPRLSEGRLILRPLQERDAPALAAMVAQPGVREWWGPEGSRGVSAEGFAEEARDEVAFAIEIDGALAGWLGFHEELEPDYRHAGLDIFLAPEYHGAGHGPAALRLAARWLIAERGHHRLTIDPARAIERAIGAYASIGFRRVGVMREYERGFDGAWHDGLLMDMLAAELR